MTVISHKFRDHVVDSKTELLIIGTFNPDISPGPDFFYGRPRNYLWQLLPQCYSQPSLKNSDLKAKKDFMREYHIDFVDLIATVEVPCDQKRNVNDTYIDGRVLSWRCLKPTIDSLSNLSAVFFTRMTFKQVSNIKREVTDIQNHVRQRGLYFACLETPARFASEAKQQFWINRVIDRESCTAL